MSGLSVAGLTKAYGRHGEVKALDDFRLDFPPEKCTVLLGPSGCGKTTVLRSIAGLITPDAGRITIGGATVFDAASRTEVPPEKRHLGMVFQSYALWPHMTVADNIAYPLLTGGLPRSEISRKAEAMLDWVGLSGMGGRYAHELSGGQQQRVSLARAMVGSPRAVLFDEPLSNLDARLRERMRMELLSLRQKVPFTSIYVTHDQLEALTLGDRVAVMCAGRIDQVGPPEEVYRRPRTRFTAEFVGIQNLLSGTVRGTSGAEVMVDTVVGPLRTRGWRSDWQAGNLCTVAVRATLLTMQSGGAGAHGRVVRTAFQGSSSIMLVDIGGTEIVVESLAEGRPAPNSEVPVRPDPDAVFALLDD